MKTEKHQAIFHTSESERASQGGFYELLQKTPVPADELMDNLGLFLTSKSLSRILFYYEMYKKIVNTHGVIIEFGVRWGQTLSVLAALRGIFEPFNRIRRIVGFDTFAGHVGTTEIDRINSACTDGHIPLHLPMKLIWRKSCLCRKISTLSRI